MKTDCVLGVRFALGDLAEAARCVRRLREDLAGRYITFCNVHTTVMAIEDAEYMQIQNDAAFCFPDGMPIVWRQRRHGHPYAERISGPDFMSEIFTLTADASLRHFFYGSKEETLEALRKKLSERFPSLVIAGMIAPPFREETPEEEAEDIRRIKEARPDIIWVGLGAPKQEIWMAKHKDIFSGVMIGVGAGFDFHAGMVKRAPSWMQRVGLEWFYRLMQDPKRLFSRYFVTNTKFVLYLIKERFSG
ncbi:MAG: WecB/TagA/CpsF family glycosyltransferase [Lachnospiraceae bacterium]|nr:WecB/TagA/CpsF family glycosyltransferase [Lachnospiraceae bacterium]